MRTGLFAIKRGLDAPFAQFQPGTFEIIALTILIGGFLARGQRGRGVLLTGPALVLKRFDLNPSDPEELLNLVGRPEGLIGWFLAALGVDTKTTLCITQDFVHVNKISLSGQIRQSAPMSAIASTHCGYSMNVALIIVAILAALGGLAASVGGRSFWPFLISLFVALLFVLAFFFSKKLVIAVETSGGTVLGVGFKKGLIENEPVGIEQVTEVIRLFNQQLRRNPKGATSTADASTTAPSNKDEQWYYTKAGKQ